MQTDDDNRKLKQIIADMESQLQSLQARMQDLHSIILSNISHDIRTPMNAIVGFANLLTDNKLNDEDREEFINQINTNSIDLLQMIDNMIDASQLECGSMPLFEREACLNEIMDELFDFYKDLYKVRDKKLNLVLSKDEDDDFSIITDKKRLKQVFNNLIGNAIKFTESGHIEFGYKYDGKERLSFYVRDTGGGFNSLTEEELFKPFRSRLRKENGDPLMGAGLGLSVSKGIVELMGGRIWTEIGPTKGTCFWFSHPVKKESVMKRKFKQLNSATKRNIASLF